MPDVCTCGAKLPPDARFCHKCGKPQRDEPVFVEEVEEPIPPPLTAIPFPVPARIGFHNLLAVRVALLAGALGLCLFVLLGQLPGLQVIAILSPVASGVFAVHLYKRKTGQRLSMASGAHLGWISGIFGFLITTLLFTGVRSHADQSGTGRSCPPTGRRHPAGSHASTEGNPDRCWNHESSARIVRVPDAAADVRRFGRRESYSIGTEGSARRWLREVVHFTMATPAKITIIATVSRHPNGSR